MQRFVPGLPRPLLVVYCTGLSSWAVDVKWLRWRCGGATTLGVCVCVFVCVCAPHEIMFMMQAGSCPCEDYLKHLFNFYWVFVSFLYEMNKVYVLKTNAFGHFIYFVDLLDMDWNLYGASLHAKMWPVHSQKYSPHVSLLPAQTFSLLRASQVTELVNESRN